jgi:hypothetical protein
VSHPRGKPDHSSRRCRLWPALHRVCCWQLPAVPVRSGAGLRGHLIKAPSPPPHSATRSARTPIFVNLETSEKIYTKGEHLCPMDGFVCFRNSILIRWAPSGQAAWQAAALLAATAALLLLPAAALAGLACLTWCPAALRAAGGWAR